MQDLKFRKNRKRSGSKRERSVDRRLCGKHFGMVGDPGMRAWNGGDPGGLLYGRKYCCKAE